MQIISAQEISGRRGQVNDKGETEYTRQFVVVCDSPQFGSYQIRTSNGIPRVGDIYVAGQESDVNSLAKVVVADQDADNPCVWKVTVTYGPPSGDEQQNNPNPLLRPAVMVWGHATAERAVWKDTDGKSIQNSAGDWYDPPLMIEEARPTLTVTRNFISFNPAIAVQYVNSVNSDAFLGNAPGIAKVAGLSASSQTENNYFFWQVTGEFHFRRDGWQPSVLDAGRNYKTQDGKLAPIWRLGVKEDGSTYPMKNTAVSEPVPLNGAGLAIRDPNPNNVRYRDFKIYKSLPFSLLGLI